MICISFVCWLSFVPCCSLSFTLFFPRSLEWLRPANDPHNLRALLVPPSLVSIRHPCSLERPPPMVPSPFQFGASVITKTLQKKKSWFSCDAGSFDDDVSVSSHHSSSLKLGRYLFFPSADRRFSQYSNHASRRPIRSSRCHSTRSLATRCRLVASGRRTVATVSSFLVLPLVLPSKLPTPSTTAVPHLLRLEPATLARREPERIRVKWEEPRLHQRMAAIFVKANSNRAPSMRSSPWDPSRVVVEGSASTCRLWTSSMNLPKSILFRRSTTTTTMTEERFSRCTETRPSGESLKTPSSSSSLLRLQRLNRTRRRPVRLVVSTRRRRRHPRHLSRRLA